MWTDKQKRGELESDERQEVENVSEAISRCDAELSRTTSAGHK
jgi:hypothetical protein